MISIQGWWFRVRAITTESHSGAAFYVSLSLASRSLPEKGVRPSPFYQYSLEINLLT